MEGAGASVKFGLAGLVAGATTAWATDRAWVYLSPYLAPGGHAPVTHSALVAVTSGAVVSLMIYAGDVGLESVIDMGSDPLFRTTYYQAAFIGSSTARTAISSVHHVLGSLLSAKAAAPPSTPGGSKPAPTPKGPLGWGEGPGPVIPPPPHMSRKMRAVPSCQSGMNCGAIML